MLHICNTKGREIVTIKEAAKYLEWSELYLREAIAQGAVDFGVCVKMPGSSRRTFQINEERLKAWKDGKK